MSKDCPGDGGEMMVYTPTLSDLSDDGVQDCEDADMSEDGPGEHSDLSDDPEALVEAGEIPPTTVQAWLNIVQDASRLKAKKAQALKQKAQALKQAKHWQASCQKERAKHMKLNKDYEQLMKENNEYKASHQKLGAWMSLGQAQFTKESDGDSGYPMSSEFQDCEDSVSPEFQLMSPHYDESVKALTDLQRPTPTPPSAPPPMYLLRQFKSKKPKFGGRRGKQAHPIGARHGQRPWPKAPPIGKGPM